MGIFVSFAYSIRYIFACWCSCACHSFTQWSQPVSLYPSKKKKHSCHTVFDDKENENLFVLHPEQIFEKRLNFLFWGFVLRSNRIVVNLIDVAKIEFYSRNLPVAYVCVCVLSKILDKRQRAVLLYMRMCVCRQSMVVLVNFQIIIWIVAEMRRCSSIFGQTFSFVVLW